MTFHLIWHQLLHSKQRPWSILIVSESSRLCQFHSIIYVVVIKIIAFPIYVIRVELCFVNMSHKYIQSFKAFLGQQRLIGIKQLIPILQRSAMLLESLVLEIMEEMMLIKHIYHGWCCVYTPICAAIADHNAL
jgi:hypothetical protein